MPKAGNQPAVRSNEFQSVQLSSCVRNKKSEWSTEAKFKRWGSNLDGSNQFQSLLILETWKTAEHACYCVIEIINFRVILNCIKFYRVFSNMFLGITRGIKVFTTALHFLLHTQFFLLISPHNALLLSCSLSSCQFNCSLFKV